MMDGAEACSNDWPRTTWAKAWAAMLSAAPAPEAAPVAPDALRKAVIAWWEGFKPVSWTEDQHRANPTVNIHDAWHDELAKMAAALSSQHQNNQGEG